MENYFITFFLEWGGSGSLWTLINIEEKCGSCGSFSHISLSLGWFFLPWDFLESMPCPLCGGEFYNVHLP